ncbi:MAG: efflux RND transporter periplasmic adaptor subunit [Planctomycetota bacterium]
MPRKTPQTTSCVGLMRRLRTVGHALWMVPLSLALGCEQEPPPPPPPPQVKVTQPTVKDVTEYYYYTGTLAPVQSVEIKARVPGFIEQVEFQPSTDIDAGTPLFVIEPARYVAAVDSAEAEVNRLKALVDERLSIFVRIETALAKKAATQSEMIEAKAQLAQARAELEAARVAVRDAEIDLGYTQVTSPIAGRVSRNLVDVGDLVGSGENTKLTTVLQIDPIWCYFDVSERIVLEYIERRDDGTISEENRDRVELALANSPAGEYPFDGVLDFVDNTVDRTTGTIRVRGVFPNPDKQLFPGLFARVRAPYGTIEDAVLVNEDAVGKGLSGSFVLVVGDDNVVSQRLVTLGPVVGRQVVVREGLEAGETYVAVGLNKARPGSPVTPVPLDADPNPDAASPPTPAQAPAQTDAPSDA